MADNVNRNPLHGWHLDKRVPLALMLAIGIQTAAMGAWVGSINTRVDRLEIEAAGSSEIRERLVRIETILERLERRDAQP